MNTKARDADKDFDTLNAAGNTRPRGIWSDGTTMWVADSGSNDKIYAYDLSTKARDSGKDFDTLVAAGIDFPRGIWSDGATMWVVEDRDNKLYAFNMTTKARDADEDFNTLNDAGNREPNGIWSDGATMWVADRITDKIYAYNMDTKARDASKDFDTLVAAGNNFSTVSWSDGITMWVADSFNSKIYSYVHRVLSTDTTLSAISVDGTDLTPFDSESTSHRHFVGSDVTEVTVAATATDAAAIVAILSPADADDTTDGHQVSIGEGTTTVTFTVKAEDLSTRDHTLSIIKPSTAYFDWKQTEDFESLADAGNTTPRGIWSDGTTMWVANVFHQGIFAYNLNTKVRDETHEFDGFVDAGYLLAAGIWSNGATMWVVDADSLAPEIIAFNLAAKTRDEAKDIDNLRAAGNTNPRYIWSDGATMWVTDTTHDKLFAYDLSTKVRDPGKDFNTLSDAGNGFPTGIWSDGRTMWVADRPITRSTPTTWRPRPGTPARTSTPWLPPATRNPPASGPTASPRPATRTRTSTPWLWVADEDDAKLYSYNLSREEALDLKFLNVNEDDEFSIDGFDPDITEYEHTEPSQIYAEIRALTKDPDAHLSYDRPNVLPRELTLDPLHRVALNEGENVVNITVTADGNPTYKQYTLTLPTIKDVGNRYGTTAWVIPAPQGSPAPHTRGAISEAGDSDIAGDDKSRDIDWINVLLEPDQLYEIVVKGKAFGNSDRTLTEPHLGGIVAAQRLPGGQDPDTGLTRPPIFTHRYYEHTWDIGVRSVSGLDGWARTIFRHSESRGALIFQVVVAGTFAENVGTYDVRVREVEDEHYPNDHTGAVDITLGIPVRGKIDYRFDQDWFRTTDLLAGHKYVIEARNGDNCYWVDVHDPDGKYINLGSRGCRFVFETKTTGRHYLKVHGLSRWTPGSIQALSPRPGAHLRQHRRRRNPVSGPHRHIRPGRPGPRHKQ